MPSNVDRLFSESKSDFKDVRSLTTKVLAWEKMLVALSRFQSESKRPTTRNAMFMAKIRISGKLIMRTSLQPDITIMKNRGFLEHAGRGKWLVTIEGHKHARKIIKEKNFKV